MGNSFLTPQELYWLSAAARAYDLGDLVASARVSDPEPNSRCHIYRLDCDRGRFALKVYPQGWWADRLYRAHAAAAWLREGGYSAPRPLRTCEGDRVLFLGENPAICMTWLAGQPLWDARTSRWLTNAPIGPRLLEAARQLAGLHDRLMALAAEPTRPRPYPPQAWYTRQIAEVRALATHDGWSPHWLDALAELLSNNTFDEPEPTQHVLIDCHPGQFLFDGDTFGGVVDFDHVASGCRTRDLSKLLATDETTLALSPAMLAAYLEATTLSEAEGAVLPAGVLRYVLTGAIQRAQRAIVAGQDGAALRERLTRVTRTLREALPALCAALGLAQVSGISIDLAEA